MDSVIVAPGSQVFLYWLPEIWHNDRKKARYSWRAFNITIRLNDAAFRQRPHLPLTGKDNR